MSARPDFETLGEMLGYRASADPDTPALFFQDIPYSFGDLFAGAKHVAGHLHKLGIGPGHRIVLVAPNGPEFFFGFYGAVLCGAVPAPIFPGSGPRRVLQFAELCGASAICSATELEELTTSLVDASRRATTPAIVTIGEALNGSSPKLEVSADREDVAFLQYTSGSTGNPKGVQLTHSCLLTNAQQMIDGMEITPDEVFVSWLPAHHDMGLILKTIVPFVLAARLVMLPTTLTRIAAWPEAISRYGGTFTAAPDFAWRLLTRFIRDPGRYDLSSLRVALNAAEPVRESTIERFEQAFGLDTVMVPGYGLAEATVGVSMQKPGTRFTVDRRGFVSIGRLFPEIEIEIVGENGSVCGADEVGELVVSSPANTLGYFRNDRATRELFWRPGWVRTGDLGYRCANGNLFLVSRKKNIIIQGGRNLAPQELEEVVDELGFARRSAAVGIDRGGSEGEQAYLFVELRRSSPPEEDVLEDMACEVVEALFDQIGIRPARVLLLRPRAIPMTANGKTRYTDLREHYLEGRLQSEDLLLYPR